MGRVRCSMQVRHESAGGRPSFGGRSARSSVTVVRLRPRAEPRLRGAGAPIERRSPSRGLVDDQCQNARLNRRLEQPGDQVLQLEPTLPRFPGEQPAYVGCDEAVHDGDRSADAGGFKRGHGRKISNRCSRPRGRPAATRPSIWGRGEVGRDRGRETIPSTRGASSCPRPGHSASRSRRRRRRAPATRPGWSK
jgi:hypothetical protein